MNVKELREALAQMPDHLPVHVAVNSDHDNGGGADTDFLYTLDCTIESFPTQGNMAVIGINYMVSNVELTGSAALSRDPVERRVVRKRGDAE